MTIGWLNACSVLNKADVISDTITDRSLDVLALQETWHTCGSWHQLTTPSSMRRVPPVWAAALH